LTKHFYIKFSLLILSLCLLSGTLSAQSTILIDDPSPVTVQTGDVFYDTGGSAGDYTNYEDQTITFTCAVGSVIRVSFTEFEIEGGYYDYLRVYDGPSSSSVLFGTYYGTNSPGVLTSSDNSITFYFHSDFSEVFSGWKATIEVVSSPCSAGSTPIWNEDFESAAIGDESSSGRWTATTTYQNARMEVGNSQLSGGGKALFGNYLDNSQGSNQEGVFLTSSIDISNYTDIRVSIDIGSSGNQMENSDYIRIYYSVDGGDDIEFSVNGSHTNDISDQTACTNVPEGGELTLKVIMRNTANNEYYYIDNINVSGETKRSDAVTLSVSSNSIDEYDGTTTITASVFEAQATAVKVYLAYSGTDNSNFSAPSQIVIPANSKSASVTFSTIDNDIIDGDRDVLVEINSVDNAVESGVQEATITIVDDEEPSQIQIPFEQRTSQYTPEKKIYNVKGDFTMIGNTNLTLYNYNDNRGNGNNYMIYVDEDSDPSTFNSSSATLDFSTENGAKPQCSNIIYAGLYWTGRANSSWSTSRKRDVLLKYAGESAYQSYTARPEDIYYPNGSESNIYAAYAEVTDYVKTHGIGEYFVADMALSEGNGGGTGYCGGWGLVVVYENSKMKWRDVTLYDGYAYVSHSGPGNNTSYEFPISGFKAVQSGDVNIKLGLMASEGDVDISGDFIEIQNAARDNWTRLSHAGNTTNNFFNSSIETGGNNRNLNRTNNTGVDIAMFDVPNTGNSNIANGQTSTRFRYGTSQDAYAIFALAMSVDAYVPEAEATNAVMTIDGNPIVDGSMVLPGQEILYQLEIRNRGTEAVNDARLVLPIPYTTEYVSSSAVVSFSPATNNVYYDPTEGATGSLVWEIGDLPVPTEGPDHILGTLTYTVKVTEDCSILGNTNCDPSVAIGGGGGSTGTGATSGNTISGFSIIQGYVEDGECVGEPIVEPIEIQIDAEDYVANNCTAEEINSEQEYFFCNLGPSASIPITEVSGNFPPGSRFYDDYPVVEGVTEEFTISNEFLADIGTTTYYAVPPGFTNCYYTFKITVKDISSTPTVNDVSYCEGDLANVIQGTPSDPAYGLYYYATETGGSPSVNFVPPTNSAGTTTYYVAEGESSTCLSPNRVPVVVTVNTLPDIINPGNITECNSYTLPVITGNNLTGNEAYYTAKNGGGIKYNADDVISSTTTLYIFDANGSCSDEESFIVTINSLPTITITGALSVCAEDPETPTDPDLVNTEIYFTEAGMSNYIWTVTGGTIESGLGTNEITVKWKNAGTGSVSVNYQNANGCSAASPKSETITIYERPNPSSITTDF
jgi:conserved repeat domain